jgi:mannose-1-phosphate guanylyltransferase
MKAILLAAGLGTRLAPITNSTPKCLVPVHGKPLLAYWLDTLTKLGVQEVLINLHYLPHQVRDFIAASPYQKMVTLVEEEELLGTAGTLFKNKLFWQNNTTMVIHADNFCLSDLSQMIRFHQNRKNNTDATLLLFNTQQPKSCGVVKLDQQSVITEFHEKVSKPPTNLASGALFIFSPNVYHRYFKYLNPNKHYELSIDIIPSMVGKLQGWHVDDFYIDIGSPETLALANDFIKQ